MQERWVFEFCRASCEALSSEIIQGEDILWNGRRDVEMDTIHLLESGLNSGPNIVYGGVPCGCSFAVGWQCKGEPLLEEGSMDQQWGALGEDLSSWTIQEEDIVLEGNRDAETDAPVLLEA